LQKVLLEKLPNTEFIKFLEENRDKLFWKFDEKNEKEYTDSTWCKNYLNKAIREINLAYVEEAFRKYKKDKNMLAWSAKFLYDEGYIKFLPTDFQQYKDYWIVYIYNEKTWNFDYEMRNYK